MGAFGELLKARWGDPNSNQCNNINEINITKRRIKHCNQCNKETIQRDLADFGMNSKWYCIDNGTGIHPVH